MRVHGVDFTSAPRRSKPIVVASGFFEAGKVWLESLSSLPDWPAFESFLTQPGPWVAGCDFPFGLPREAVVDLNWPTKWDALVRHCEKLGKAGFRQALDAYRLSRPIGRRYAHRSTDHFARSHSPLKLVNPPVGLMFLEGAPRLLCAGLEIPGIQSGDPERIGVEAYPGLLARDITHESYKSDTRSKQTAARQAARCKIADALISGDHPLGIRLEASAPLHREMVDDASGDRLDATLAMMQAANAASDGPPWYGLNPGLDAIEGWIATVPVTGSRS